ncbi:MAG TPA: arylamine N-acetyltransferase [Solirubrobacteraceae bacterium]|nr:arylamine N-acetyltransferase [Solirubrobacteraceae bacterium]
MDPKVQSGAMLDLEAYLERIGLSGRPGPAEVHRAHVTSIPFENLDPRRGIPVSLAPEDLERKLVTERRGGYCFEQNLLLKSGLEALGARVEPMLGRVRVGYSRGNPRPRTHLVLRVQADGADWHADAGFGHGTLLEPIPFGPGGPYTQSGWQFRVVEDGAELVLETFQDGEWIDLYGFVPEPVPFVDIETSNWFTSTYPRSPFVTGLIVSAQRPDGARVSLSDWHGLSLREETPTGGSTRPVEPDEVRELIQTQFGLNGFDD